MKVLVVHCHPLPESLTAHLAARVRAILAARGDEVRPFDLYAEAFPPALTAAERAAYYAAPDHAGIRREAEDLAWAEGLVLVFPTWWFGLPAVLKGWVDRVFAPGVAYDHAPGLLAIRPRLHGLRHALAVTTLGAPWWVDRLVMRRPVRRVLKTGLIGTCAPRCRFDMVSLYTAEKATPARVAAFEVLIARRLARWPRA